MWKRGWKQWHEEGFLHWKRKRKKVARRDSASGRLDRCGASRMKIPMSSRRTLRHLYANMRGGGSTLSPGLGRRAMSRIWGSAGRWSCPKCRMIVLRRISPLHWNLRRRWEGLNPGSEEVGPGKVLIHEYGIVGWRVAGSVTFPFRAVMETAHHPQPLLLVITRLAQGRALELSEPITR